MLQPLDILTMARRQPVMQEQLDLLYDKERTIPGSVEYAIKRYRKDPQWNIEDVGMMVYHYKKNEPQENYLELRFCVAGNMYCKEKETACDQCRVNATRHCEQKVESVDTLSFRFRATHLLQYVKGKNSTNLTDEVLHFK